MGFAKSPKLGVDIVAGYATIDISKGVMDGLPDPLPENPTR
jgi:hypothetical protein